METTAITEALVEHVAETSVKEPGTLFVILMGLCVVFFGLICIVAICWLMGRVIGALEKNAPAQDSPAKSAAAVPQAEVLSPEKRREMIAAISAAVAEELGTDVSAIRITSFKRI